MGVLHVTHSMPEAALFDRVVVMDAGRFVLDGRPTEVFRHAGKLRAIGLDVPLVASLADRLRARGVPLGGDILDEADLRVALSALAGSPAPAKPS
jgi:energy-coupling factor transport system ATP-binding protein